MIKDTFEKKNWVYVCLGVNVHLVCKQFTPCSVGRCALRLNKLKNIYFKKKYLKKKSKYCKKSKKSIKYIL